MSKIETNKIDSISGTSTLKIGETNATTLDFDTGITSVTNIPQPITNAPAFFVKKTSNQTLSDNAVVKLTFESVDVDTDSGFDNTTNHRYTIPTGKAGKYLFFYHVQASSGTASQARQLELRLRKNGSNILHTRDRPYINDATAITMSASIIHDCSAGDYFELFAQMDVGSGNVSVESYTGATNFGAYRLIGV